MVPVVAPSSRARGTGTSSQERYIDRAMKCSRASNSNRPIVLWIESYRATLNVASTPLQIAVTIIYSESTLKTHPAFRTVSGYTVDVPSRADRANWLDVRQIFVFADQLDALGYPGTQSLAEVSISPSDDPSWGVPFDVVMRWGDLALASCTDPDIGLRLGTRIPFGLRPLLDNLLAASATLGAALELVDRRSLHPTSIFGWRHRADQVAGIATYVAVAPPDFVRARWHLDLQCASALSDLRRILLSADFSPLEVGFAYPRPMSSRLHRTIFGCPVLFGQPETSISISAEMLELPLPGANPSLVKLLESLADQRSDEPTPPGDLRTLLRRHIAASLRSGTPQLDSAARALGLSPRTLRRRLQALGTSFQAEVVVVRRNLAQQYLLRSDSSIQEISLALGFTKVTAFHRAFKRWTGLTPFAFRTTREGPYPSRRESLSSEHWMDAPWTTRDPE